METVVIVITILWMHPMLVIYRSKPTAGPLMLSSNAQAHKPHYRESGKRGNMINLDFFFF